MPLSPLPIDDFLPQICGYLHGPGNLVLVAEPGAGKSTRVAPAVARQLAGRVLLLQPRRLAARAVAGRIAEESGTPVGGDFVGYQVRFDNRTSARTRIVVMTEGLLARIIQTDPFLEGISCVILDEFHERSIHTDLAIALLREIQQQVRPDLRIIAMSATLDAGPVAEFLGGAPLLQVPGRTFPLEISHAPRHDARPLEARMADAITAAAGPGSGPAAAPHILAFLPGLGEIRRTQSALPAALTPRVHVLHSSISAEDQDAALRPGRQQKIILATNIAETSLTIDGVGLVIDSGLARVPVHDNRLGLDRLETRRISKASARQRAGRAGRSAAGRAIRLFTAEEFSAMDDFDTPEILRLDLAHTVLTLLTYGTPDVRRFPWFQPPPDAAVQRAQHLLTLLGAIDRAGHLLEFGRQLAALPLHPRLGAIYLQGGAAGHTKEAAWLCALLEDDDCRPTLPQHSGSLESDMLDRLDEVLHRRGTPASWAAQNAARQLQRLAALAEGRHTPGELSAALGQALLRGFPDRVCQRRAAADVRALMVGRRGVELARESRVASAELFLAIELRDRDSAREALVTSASAIRAEWLEQHLPSLVRTEETVAIHRGKPRGVRRTWYQDLLLKEVEIGQVPAGLDLSDILRATLVQQHGSAQAAVTVNPAAEEWLRRYAFVRAHLPEAGLPSPDFEQVLSAACSGAKSADQALANALACLKGLAPAGTDVLLNEHAPEYLPLPSGNRARVSYPPLAEGHGGELQSAEQPPSLAARVQELFGLAETPRLAGGRVPLLIELLSPARRPVQITADLRSFWNGAYQEVRKELRARYPKHPWPEDPWTAPAVSVGSRRRS